MDLNKQEPAPAQSTGYAWYVLIILMIAYISSFIDRQILNLLVEPIKKDLKIDDTAVSLLQGFSFALFYTLLGIPIGRLADSFSRKWIISLGIGVWSFMTIYCGMARNYGQLLLGRIGVGVGEAALTPAAYSMIADLFPKNKLAFAMSVYSMGIYIGSGLSFVLGALAYYLAAKQRVWQLPLIGEVYYWQLVFFIVGLPGLLIALWIATVREPVRKSKLMKKDEQGNVITAQVSLGEVLDYIFKNGRAFFGISLGIAFISLGAYAGSAWIPSYFIRVFGWSQTQIGLAYGMLVTVFATSGVISGGRFADKWRREGYADGNIRVCLTASIFLLFLGGIYTLIPYAWLALILIAFPSFFCAFPIGAAAAAIQDIMPNQMRAMASSIYFFILNIIALGFGPTAVALITNKVFNDDKMVGYSLLIVGLISTTIAAFCLYSALKPYKKSLEYLAEYQQKHL
jgi:MFS family permease